MSCPSTDQPIWKNKKKNVLILELPQHSRTTRTYGLRGALCGFFLEQLRAKERDRKVHLITLLEYVKERGLVA